MAAAVEFPAFFVEFDFAALRNFWSGVRPCSTDSVGHERLQS
jgi:hypothetical protein